MISKINSIKVMKKQLFATFIAIVFIGSNALAYYGPNDKSKKPTGKPKANCSPATAKYIMEFNDVRALIEQGGSMFQNRQNGVAAYEVPKGSNTITTRILRRANLPRFATVKGTTFGLVH